MRFFYSSRKIRFTMTKGDRALLSRLAKGMGAQGYSQAAQIFIRLAEVPLLLGYWGTQLYGEWLILSAIPAYLAICDGGFTGAASREMSMRSGAGDRPGALSLFQSTWILLLLVSLGFGLLTFVVAQVAPLPEWLGFKVMNPATVKLVILLLVAHVLVGFQTGLVYGGFWCEGRYAMGISLSVSMQLMEFGGLAIAVALGGGPAGAASGYLGGRIGGFFLMRFGLYRATPWLHYGWRLATLGQVRCLTGPAFASLAFPLGNALNIQGMRLVVGLVLGPPMVAVFSTLRTLTRLAMQPSSVINRLMEPEMASAYGGNRYDVLRRLFTRSCQAALWMSAASCILLGMAGEWVLGIWTHGKVAMDWYLYSLLLLGAAVNAVWYTAMMAAYATNRHVRVALVYSAVYGGAAIGLAFVFTKISGLAGVGLALLLTEIAMAPYVLLKTLQLTGESWASWLGQVARPPWFLFRRIRDVSVVQG
jgi:O-antigen/teichoic acid export membrane protein